MMIGWFLNSAYAASNYMPPEGTRIANYFDTLYGFLLVASFVACVIVIGGLVYFAIKYRRQSEDQKSAYITHNNALEFAWSFIPFLIFMFAFGWGWWVYVQFRTMPKDALEIHVVAQKWVWTFLYNSGRTSSAELYIPVDTPVKLIMTSKDVIHSFFVPAFREKQDVVPGRYSQLWFQANKPGNYQVFCAEYCGTGHSTMMAKVHVLPLKDYEHWLASDPYRGLSLADVGKKIYGGRCVVCHNVTAERKIGPGFLHVYGSKQPLDDGTEILADDNYIRESILYPNAKIVRTYPKNVMPSFQGQLTEQELSGVIEYLKTLKQ